MKRMGECIYSYHWHNSYIRIDTFMKTNKSFYKRLKVTKTGKLIGRSPGQNHFRAKKSRRAELGKKRTNAVFMSNRARRRFL